MARVARERSKTGIYHIILRGVNRQNIFEDKEDRFRLLEILRHYKGMDKYEIYGFCLMSNHIHILIQELDDSISVAVKRISSSYVFWYNKKYERIGHLFQGRFNSEPVEDDIYFLTVLRYIHQNPLKAGVINDIAKYRWSSYEEYLSKANLVDTSLALGMFSTKETNVKNAYVRFMNEDNDDKCLDLEDKVVSKDEDVLDYLKVLGIHNISTLQQMDISSRNSIIRKVKDKKLASIRQLSRITGISKSIIERA